MDHSYSHFGTIDYNFDVYLRVNVLELFLTITQKEKVKKYKAFFIDDSLPD